ncbi:hypothetical protein GJ496_001206 [Pomphorhynchus laevis]|nr:hypothetical protein GJ496_001206 [Pomphorhynchus laevis]
MNDSSIIMDDALLSVFTCARSLGVYVSAAGYVLIECGSSRSQNAVHSISKFTIVSAIVFLTWWVLGYTIAFGRPSNGLLGYGGSLILANNDSISRNLDVGSSLHILLHGIICLQAVLCTCCSFTERLPMFGHCLHAVLMSGIVFPTICHWIWSDDGWLYRMGALDVGGSTVVAVTSGVSGLIGTFILGPRITRFSPRQIPIFGHNLPLTTTGYMMVALGLCCLNCHSNGPYNLNLSYAPRSLSVTFLSGSSSVIIFTILSKILEYKGKMLKRRMHLSISNAMIAGMVAVSAGSGFYPYWASIVIGICTALFYSLISKLLTFIKIDDPADTCSVNISGGVLGTLISVISIPMMSFQGYRSSITVSITKMLGTNCLAILCVSIWAGVCYGFLFVVLTMLKVVRLSYEDELRGIDLCKFGEPAYALRIYCASCGEQLQNQHSNRESLKELQSDEYIQNPIITETEGAIVPLECFLGNSSVIDNYSSSEPC